MYSAISEKCFDWRRVKNASLTLGFPPKKAPSGRFPYQNLYHVSAFKMAYPEYNYDFERIIPRIAPAPHPAPDAASGQTKLWSENRNLNS